MGEHQGTGRTVDSTTDRLELLAEGLTPDSDLTAAVNGVRVPLVLVGNDRALGAIRYRLFDNPWGLQPHIRSHCPLGIEIIQDDTVVHALDYLNWKPPGEVYDGPPTSDDDARQRVAERLRIYEGRIGAVVTPREVPVSPDAPFTLDMRRS